MVTKEQIAKIIRDETWVEVDSARVYGIDEAAEKILQAIEAAQQSVKSGISDEYLREYAKLANTRRR